MEVSKNMYSRLSSAKYVSKTPFGTIRNVRRFTWLEWTYMAVVIISILAVFSLSIKSLVGISEGPTNASACASSCVNDVLQGGCDKSCDSWTCKEDFIFAVLLLINLERGFETLAYLLGVVAVYLYVAINFVRNPGTGSTYIFKLLRLVAVGFTAPLNIFLGLIVWLRMGKLNFLMVGSNGSLMKAFHIRSSFVTLVVFNVELMASITTLAFARNSAFLSIAEMVVLPMVLCLTILLAAFTVLILVRYEWRKTMFLYYPFSTITTIYYLYKIINVAIEFHDYKSTPDHCSTPEGNYLAVAAVLLLACILGILAYPAIITVACITHHNFGKGLKNIGGKKEVPPTISVSLENRTI